MNTLESVVTKNGLTITAPLPDVWRLQTADDAKGVIQTLAALTGKKPEGAHAARQLSFEGAVVAAGDGVRVELTRDGVDFIGSQGEKILELSRLIQKDHQLSLEFGLQPEEALFGAGERFNGVNQRGKKVTVWAEDRWCHTEGNSYTDSQSESKQRTRFCIRPNRIITILVKAKQYYLPIPFILSSRNYAVLINRFEASKLDLGSECPNRWNLTQLDAPLDVYFIFGNQPVDIYAKLVKLWGNPVVPPAWSWGTLVSRHLHDGDFAAPTGILEMAAQMAKHDLP